MPIFDPNAVALRCKMPAKAQDHSNMLLKLRSRRRLPGPPAQPVRPCCTALPITSPARRWLGTAAIACPVRHSWQRPGSYPVHFVRWRAAAQYAGDCGGGPCAGGEASPYLFGGVASTYSSSSESSSRASSWRASSWRASLWRASEAAASHPLPSLSCIPYGCKAHVCVRGRARCARSEWHGAAWCGMAWCGEGMEW